MQRGQMIPRGDRKWLLRVFIGRDAAGKRKYLSKMIDGTTAQARQELTKLLRAGDTQSLVASSRITFPEFVQHWYTLKASVSPRTLDGYRNMLNLYVLPSFAHRKLQEITPLQMQTLYNSLRDGGLSPRTIAGIHRVIHQVFAKAIRLGLLVRNPAQDTERPKVTRRSPTILTAEQIQTLLRSTAGSSYHALWVVLLTTGLRPGETLALQWSDFDGTSLSVQRALKRDADGSYHVEDVPKTKRSYRVVTLPPTAIEALREHRQRQAAEMLEAGPRYQRLDYIFASNVGTPLDPANVASRWRTALRHAGLPRVRLYDTRHSHATALLTMGVNLAWVSDRLGHENIILTRDTYAHVLPEAHKETAEVMERVLHVAR